MNDAVSTISLSDHRTMAQVDTLLKQEGIQRDENLDYVCGIFDEDWNLSATGSCFRNTLRCLAVSNTHQGEGLLNQIMSHLLEIQLQRGNSHVFLYTKPDSAKFMTDLGFYEIDRVPGKLVFMENRRGGFRRFCEGLAKGAGQRIAGIVMNANPFTRGHLHLIEKAAQENDVLHLFVLSEEAGPIPFAVRKKLVKEGVRNLSNVIVHDSGPYMISSATFPSYFLKDKDTVIRTQAELDLHIFGKIAEHLGIQRRYVGQEQASHVTSLYNEVMKKKLPEAGIQCIEIPRLTLAGNAISASTVRKAIQEDRLEDVKDFLPESSCRYFTSEESEAVRRAIQAEKDLIHY